jgi:DUF1365 family protein
VSGRASCIYEGEVTHRRHEPVEHAFRFRLYMMYVDLAELDELFRGRWLWSTKRAAVARFRRSDYLGPADRPLDEAVRDRVEATGERRPAGPIRMLTHFRYGGFVFNPVTFYYAFDAAGERVESVVAEITNTPWNERHAYVLSASVGHPPGRLSFRFEKAFHVSPFFGMDHEYRWRFGEPGDRLAVQMENFREGRRLFEATLAMERVEIDGRSLARVLARYPAMTARVLGAIYWQALRLKRKGAPFFEHPGHRDEIDREKRAG